MTATQTSEPRAATRIRRPRMPAAPTPTPTPECPVAARIKILFTLYVNGC